MDNDATGCSFEATTTLDATRPTLIEGLPGLGLVASIAVDEITHQLDLEHHGNIRSDAFPPVASFQDGRTRDLVRVYAGENPDVMTLLSDVPTPGDATSALARCVFGDLAEEFARVIFIAGAPAPDEDALGDVHGVATTEDQWEQLKKADVPVAEGSGAIGGPTGALMSMCHKKGLPAIALVVKAHPQLPDPGSARAAIEEGLEPLVDFDIDTSKLAEQAEEIRMQKENIARQIQHAMRGQVDASDDASELSMFQ